MLSNMKMRIPVSAMRRSLSKISLVFVAFFLAAPLALAQAPATRFVGTISGTTLSVKTDADGIRQFDVPSTAAIKRISPGQKDLSAADTLQFSDLETGDRVLVKLDPVAPGPPAQALQIVAVKQADLV